MNDYIKKTQKDFSVKLKERFKSYLHKHNLDYKIPEEPIKTSQVIEIPCNDCGVITKKEIKYLLKTDRVPRCNSCSKKGQIPWNKKDVTDKYLRMKEFTEKHGFDAKIPKNLRYQPFTVTCKDCGKKHKKYASTVEKKNTQQEMLHYLRCRDCYPSSFNVEKYHENRNKKFKERVDNYLKLHKYNPEEFHIPNNRTKFSIGCFDCKKSVNKYVHNLLKNFEKPPRCRSCGGLKGATEEAREKFRETMLEKYGVENPMQVPELKLKAWQTAKKRGPIKQSKQELEILEFVKTHYKGEVEYSNRSVLKGKELDLYLPELKLAIEFNGLYWHCEIFKDKWYHFNKRLACEAQGIRLIQINEDEWTYKRLIVESMLKLRLGVFDKKIFARKTEIKAIPNKEANDFLKENHLMGEFNTAKYKGLYFKGELVSLIGYKKYKEGIDISRFCSKKGYLITGGLSKLLKSVETEKPKFIQYYIDLRYGTGKEIEGMGYILQGTTLGWKWTDWDVTYNRLFCRANMDSRGLSEIEHAVELEVFKFYDSGQRKYVKSI